jgi:hypothetical protein
MLLEIPIIVPQNNNHFLQYQEDPPVFKEDILITEIHPQNDCATKYGSWRTSFAHMFPRIPLGIIHLR